MKISPNLLASTALAATLLLTAAHAADAPPTAFEMRLVVDCKPASVPVPYRHQGASDALCLAPDLILSRADITGAAEVHTAYGEDAVRVSFGPDGVTRLTAATTAHVGGHFAILYGGKIVAVPIVQEPITGNQLEITLGISADSLGAMVADLRRGKPQ